MKGGQPLHIAAGSSEPASAPSDTLAASGPTLLPAETHKGWKLGYSVRCSPVTLGDCLTAKELTALAELAVEKGWAKDTAEGRWMFRNWHLAALVGKTVPGCWTLNGEGLAIYLTRPGA